MNLRAVVVGIPGVGKSTVVDKVVAGFPGAKLVNFGTVMFEEALARKWVKIRDEMRKMPVEKQKRLQKVAATKIARMREKAVIVDTHLFIRTEEGFWPGLPFDVVRAMKPTHLVLIIAKPEEIAKRRSADATRVRDSLTSESLTEELELARSFLAVSSTLTGAPMTVISNDEGKQEEVAQSLLEMLEKAAKR
ncbi:MAG TPA: adenylate kinase [Nitrososphaerales archaeon]|nr:adenylate kinase [Nitrososphaerales archaeon]